MKEDAVEHLKKQAQSSLPRSRKAAERGTTLAALEHCWHLTCCDFLFDVLEEAGVDMHPAGGRRRGSSIPRGTLVLRHCAEGRAVSVGSGAAVLLKRFEDQFEGDSPIVEDFVKVGRSVPRAAETLGRARGLLST